MRSQDQVSLETFNLSFECVSSMFWVEHLPEKDSVQMQQIFFPPFIFLLKFLLKTDSFPYLPYFLYSRSKGWLTLLLCAAEHSHLWIWAGCSNTGEHRPRSNSAPLGSGALLKHQQPPKHQTAPTRLAHSVSGLQWGYASVWDSPELLTCYKLIAEME